MFHTVKLSKSDPTPIYIQLASELAKLIQQDLLYEGMKLPTIRLLSKQLSINRDTVVSAYKLLEQQGLVESHIGKGTYISARKSPKSASLSANISQKPHICCSHLGLSSSFFPSTLCQELTNRIIEEEGWEAFRDPLYRGRKILKQNASDFLTHLGVEAHFAQTHVISSMDHFLLQLFKLSPKLGVCVETPRELSTSCYLRSIGAKIYEVPLTPDGMDLEILEKHLHTGMISYIFVSPYLQNPTGICTPQPYLQKLLHLAQQYDCIIVEDGTYCDFLQHTHYVPLYNLSGEGRVIYLYHFSKVYLPYLKYSFAVLPIQLLKRLNDEVECSFNERFLQYYLHSQALQDIEKQIIETCKERYNTLCHALKDASHRLICTDHQGGLFTWCKVPENDYQELCRELSQRNIIIAPGELFSTTPLNGYFRISISDMSERQIQELIFCIDDILSKNPS